MGVLTDKRESKLLTLIRSDEPWEQKRDALAAFDYAEPARVESVSDNTAKPWLPDTADEFRLALSDGLLTFDQYHEVLVLMEQQSKSGKAADDKPADEPEGKPAEDAE